MLGNFVNAEDFAAAARAVVRPDWASAKLHVRRRDRVMATWGPVRATSSHWYDLPTVLEHRVRRAAAGMGNDHVERFVGTYLGERSDLLALSVGCGTGYKELRWARTGRFSRLDAFDLSGPAIDAARAAAADAGLSDVTHFFEANLFELPGEKNGYDVVIFEDSLHHLSPLVDAIRKTETLLRSGGYVVVHEYIGPDRQQMRPHTVKIVNALLSTLPASYRRQANGAIKQRVSVPSRLRMILRDPSEAPESSSMLRLLGERFDLLELTMLGGTLTYPLLDGIAQNFTDEQGEALLSAILTLEDALIDTGDVSSDYVFATYQRRG